MDKEVAILGGGIAGLGVAYELGKERSIVYEKENYSGGLCNSFRIGDYIFDTAIHLSFTKDKIVRKIFDNIKYNTHIPQPTNYYSGNWIRHPIQNNLYFLSDEEKLEAVVDFINKPKLNKEPKNYKEYLYSHYGKYIAEKFFDKYTRKYWCASSEVLGIEWIENRMYDLSMEKLLKSILLNVSNGEYYAKEMRYPQRGGYKSFLKPLIDKVDIMKNKNVELIDTSKKYIEFSDGTKEYYNKLISSLPLPELVIKLKENHKEIQQISDKLHATSIILVSIGFKNYIELNSLWFYIYDEDIPFCRVHLPHKKSSNNVPNGCSSIQCEIYYDRKRNININKDNLVERVVENLINMNICTQNDISFVDIREKEYANVVFDLETKKNKEIVKKFINKREIELVGRFGEWEYFWSDQSLLSGINKAKEYKVRNGVNL
ncbi:NAD(P)-binding protein [Clostridium sp. YIM B02555]|uniref:protoporphyrinogen/coproporphyrinogen oxidase n=1 Tax=Clostridium sp. YIM B02555 TaxID=2911968 RepID=UPI001EEF71ED|nr:NAD(P)-binding protein [Clostridium sp. YIM B02555]